MKIVLITIFVFGIFPSLLLPDAYGPKWQPRVSLQKSPHQLQAIDWSQEIVYFLLIDRFFNGDSTNDAGNNPQSHVQYDPQLENDEALKTYQGGDLAGVIQKLDYLDSLGVSTIWLSPVFDNSDSDFMGWWPYHGYHPIDFFQVDEHFGSLDLLRELVAQAHARGLKVILDMIYNHVAPDHKWVKDKTYWEEQGYSLWFHPHSGVDGSTSIQDWQDQQQLETRELAGLPDLAQENPHVYDFLLDVSRFWIVETNCDGFRLDAVKHIPPAFWESFCRDIHNFAGDDFLLLGEVFSGDTEYVAGYQDLGFNALFDIPMYYTLKRVFAQGSVTTLLSKQIQQNEIYDSILLSPLIDNHDVARFSYWAQDNVEEKTKLALSMAWSLNGLPMLYYGTEMALPGAGTENEQTGKGQDYLNRLPLPWDNVKKEHAELFEYIQQMNQKRRNLAPLQRGAFVELYKDYGVYAFLKYTTDQAVLILINNSAFAEPRAIPLFDLFAEHSSFVDELSGDTFHSYRDTLKLSLPARSALWLTTASTFAADQARILPSQCTFTPKLTRDLQRITVTFTSKRQLGSVALAGDFNGWSPAAHSLHFNSETNVWHINLPLKSGTYRYKFVLNGEEWISDPKAEQFEIDPYGGKNSILVVE